MDTKQKLMNGALDAVREHGIAGVSARTVASAAGVNQALVFYHFTSVNGLLGAACLSATEERVALYREELATVASLAELLALGRSLHEREAKHGSVELLAQLLAGAQVEPQLVEPVAAALRLWTAEIEQALRRILAGSVLSDLADPAALAMAVSASFIGMELFEGVDPDGTQAALDALDQLAILAEVVDDLGPVVTRAVRAKLRRTARKRKP